MAFVLAAVTGELAYAQSVTAPGERPTNGPVAGASSGASNFAPYCPELQRVIMLALAKERFAAIAGKPRHGDFQDTTLPLSGWKDCSLYGTRTYTCDFRDAGSAEEIAKNQAAIVDEIKSCLEESWAEDADRSSSTYVVLRSKRAPVSMTVSSGANGADGYVVRLTLFVRTGG